MSGPSTLTALFTATLCVILAMPVSAAVVSQATGKYWVYVGTYTSESDSDGIYVFSFDVATGQAGPVELAARSANPSFLAVHPSHESLYAVSEVADYGEKQSGAVIAFSIDRKSGRLKLINHQSSVGAGPCHLVVDRLGKNVLVANYGGGSVASLPIHANGRLGTASSFIQHKGSSVDPRRQQGPHAHSINLDSANRYAIAADLGLDRLLVYRFDAGKGTLVPNNPGWATVDPGAGPRHFTFHPSGKFAYVINEMNLTVTAFGYDEQQGVLTTQQTISTLPPDTKGDRFSTAEIRAHPSGKFLYGSNRGHNSIAVFQIDEETGKLTHVENESTLGQTPRNFFIDPTGAFLLAENQASDNVVLFRIDPKTGELTATGTVIEVPRPVCIRMVPVVE